MLRLPIAVTLLAVCLPAHALERITLRNGFDLTCDSHETLDASHIRVYHSAGNYQDLPSAQIASIEKLPDPPPTPIAVPAPAPTPAVTIPALLATAGTQHNIDVALLASIIHVESAGNTHARSRAGAAGLMQLMPATARDHAVTDREDPAQNINGGTAYLDELLLRYDPRGDANGLAMALAAYNAGPAAVDRYHGIPPYAETRAYVSRVLREFIRRKAATSSRN